jgi:topoisomerase-4 subunit A
MTLTAADLAHYQGDRGRRGNKLPRGLQRVDGIEVEKTGAVSTQTDEIDPIDGNGSGLPLQ